MAKPGFGNLTKDDFCESFLEEKHTTQQLMLMVIRSAKALRLITKPESRANMQPYLNSIWFAKMKNSVKHLYLNRGMIDFIDSSILSTGFYGLKCNDTSFEYIASVVSAPIFEATKDRLSHGATQQGISDDDMRNMLLLVPDKETLARYHNATKHMYASISKNLIENKKLSKLRDFLLPLLMNGQATITD